MAQIENPEAAMRLARAIASDIALYNEKKIVEGLEQDSFFELMGPELEEGVNHYKSRVSPSVYENNNFFERAIIDVIIFRKAHIRTRLW